MRFGSIDQTTGNLLLSAVISEFERGIEMIVSVDDRVYAQTANGTGSVGGHFRHNLDFVTSFLKGIAEGQIDYNRRERDVMVETDRKYAIEKFGIAIRRLAGLTDEMLGWLIYVRSEIDDSVWLPSSILRELEFLQSHTVHHHALIREKLILFGLKVDAEFGVARSTLVYWRQSQPEKQLLVRN